LTVKDRIDVEGPEGSEWCISGSELWLKAT